MNLVDLALISDSHLDCRRLRSVFSYRENLAIKQLVRDIRKYGTKRWLINLEAKLRSPK